MDIKKNPWFSVFRDVSQVRKRIFCFPYAGGGPIAFRRWPYKLPEDVQMCAVHLPGREHRLREDPFTRMEPLLDALCEAIEPHLDQPFVFFGHSMGGLVSFELARLMRKRGMPLPMHLSISSFRAPQHSSVIPGLHKLSDEALIDKLRSLNGTPEWVLQNSELMEMILPTIRADFELCDAYSYEEHEPFDFSISAFGGRDDHLISEESVKAWAIHTNADFSYELFPGGHFYIHTSSRNVVLGKLSEQLQDD